MKYTTNVGALKPGPVLKLTKTQVLASTTASV